MTGSNNNGEGTDPPQNIFRDTLIRYLGYTNEVGESFRYQYPRFVIPSYIISFGYCCADAGNTGWSVYNATHGDTLATAVHTGDTLVWQSLASVLIPGAVIHAIVGTTKTLLNRSSWSRPYPALMRWGPTAAGLGAIPFIIHPIDAAVDVLLDNTLRPYYPETKNMAEGESSNEDR